jgi:Immunity protein 17
MTGPAADFFMGGLAIALGLAALLASLLNWEGAYQLRKAHWLEGRLGRRGVRLCFAALGALLIALGAAIAMGFTVIGSAS